MSAGRRPYQVDPEVARRALLKVTRRASAPVVERRPLLGVELYRAVTENA